MEKETAELTRTSAQLQYKTKVLSKESGGLLERNARFLEEKQRKIEEIKRDKEANDEANKCSFKPTINKNAAKKRNIEDLMTWKAKADTKLNTAIQRTADGAKKSKVKAFAGPVYTNNRFTQLETKSVEIQQYKEDLSVVDRLYNYKDYYQSRRLISEKITYDASLKADIQMMNLGKNQDNDKTIYYKTDKMVTVPDLSYCSMSKINNILKNAFLEESKDIRVHHTNMDDVRTPTKCEKGNYNTEMFNDKVARRLALDRSVDEGRGDNNNNRSFCSLNVRKSRTPNRPINGGSNEGVDTYIRKIEKEMKQSD